ncbi:MAG TPA: hypothetical protein VI776_02650 [Anaerolineales bacterium]|jgi:uncharacterized membrane protein YagU involved in acid resistance|nr:hypothetical protein [Anaerolineales bacterium]
MSTITQGKSATASTGNRVVAGAVAGLAGGLVFGLMMGMMGMLPMVGMLVRQESAAVGFIVHMAISAFVGAVYGLVAGRLALSWAAAVAGGIIYGIIWWILGALIAMPILLGMSQMVLAVGRDQWFSLAGHLVFGIVTALAFIPLSKRL